MVMIATSAMPNRFLMILTSAALTRTERGLPTLIMECQIDANIESAAACCCPGRNCAVGAHHRKLGVGGRIGESGKYRHFGRRTGVGSSGGKWCRAWEDTEEDHGRARRRRKLGEPGGDHCHRDSGRPGGLVLHGAEASSGRGPGGQTTRDRGDLVLRGLGRPAG